ncbi:MAG: hypothetical protein ACRDRR_04255 [Pseudonocardiaceae bacterium]
MPAVELRKLAARGALARLGHGVYRMLEAPTGRLDEFAEAVAMAGEGRSWPTSPSWPPSISRR